MDEGLDMADNPLRDFLMRIKEKLLEMDALSDGEDAVVKIPGELMDDLLEQYASESELEAFMNCQIKYENYEGAEGIRQIMIRRGYRKEEGSSDKGESTE